MFCLKLTSFAVVIVCLGNSVYGAITPEEKSSMKAAMYPALMGCIEEFDIKKEQIEKFMKSRDPEDIGICSVSCFLKKMEFFDSKGMYDLEKSEEFTKQHIQSEEDLAIIDKIRQDCAKVNKEEVSDGDKGCERAKLLYACFNEHADEVDLSFD